MTTHHPPDGYVRARVGRTELVARREVAEALGAIVARGTLYDFARAQPDRREYRGRAAAFAVEIPGTGERAVVRHSRHGGLLASLTRDLFLAPTRAPHELAISTRLLDARVPTPLVLGYAVYRTGAGLARSDVLTREVPASRDLAAALAPSEPEANRRAAWTATASLVGALSELGARHHDLNLKNVLLVGAPDGPQAWVLDVDRITFHADVRYALRHNLARLERSARKWRDRWGAAIGDADLAAVREALSALA